MVRGWGEGVAPKCGSAHRLLGWKWMDGIDVADDGWGKDRWGMNAVGLLMEVNEQSGFIRLYDI